MQVGIVLACGFHARPPLPRTTYGGSSCNQMQVEYHKLNSPARRALDVVCSRCPERGRAHALNCGSPGTSGRVSAAPMLLAGARVRHVALPVERSCHRQGACVRSCRHRQGRPALTRPPLGEADHNLSPHDGAVRGDLNMHRTTGPCRYPPGLMAPLRAPQGDADTRSPRTWARSCAPPYTNSDATARHQTPESGCLRQARPGPPR